MVGQAKSIPEKFKHTVNTSENVHERDKTNRTDSIDNGNGCSPKDEDFGCGKPNSTPGAFCAPPNREPISLMPPSVAVLMPKFMSLQFHIRVLYVAVTCLALLLISSMVIFFLEIRSLREELSHKVTLQDMVEINFPQSQSSGEHLGKDLFWPFTSSSAFRQEDGSTWFEGEEEGEGGDDRQKRHAIHNEGSGDADDWAWMSSYARIPVVALENYCKESRMYCAANGPAGPPGTPGQPGNKGEPGEKGSSVHHILLGTKGDSPDESSLVQNLANYEALRGPPGPKGEKGERGFMGPQGPPGIGQIGEPGVQGPRGEKGDKGDRGVVGFPGKKGQQGERGHRGEPGLHGFPGEEGVRGNPGKQGIQGPKGERGESGVPGVPGFKGLPGQPGPTGRQGPTGPVGPKGEDGVCHVQCIESSLASEEPKTTPEPTYPPLSPRTSDCYIRVFGKPVYERGFSDNVGAWMSDLGKSNGFYWVTEGLQGSVVTQFSNHRNLMGGVVHRTIQLLEQPFYGTGHVVYNDHLYYHLAGQPKIVRFDLMKGQATTVRNMSKYKMVYEPTEGLKSEGYLYESQTSFIDFNVDQNGLWVVYVHKETHNLAVALLDPVTMDVITAKELGVPGGVKGNGFIVCGKLYTLRHFRRKRSILDTVTDIWTNETSSNDLRFTNPFGHTSMATVHVMKNIVMTWDAGKALSVPFLLE